MATNLHPQGDDFNTSLSDGLITEVCSFVQRGNFRMTACIAAKIPRKFARRWLDLGRRHAEKWDPDAGEVLSVYGRLFTRIEYTEAVTEDESLNHARWDPAMYARAKWFLEKRYPRNYQLETSMRVGKVDVEHASDDSDALREAARAKLEVVARAAKAAANCA